jgi:hypothetical protein
MYGSHHDDHEVEERERTADAAEEIDEAGDQHKIAAELNVGLNERSRAQDAKQHDVDEARDVGEAREQKEEIEGRQLRRAGELRQQIGAARRS